MKPILPILKGITYLIVCSLIFSCKSSSDQGVLLKFDLPKGGTYELESQFNTVQEVAGQESVIDNSSRFGIEVSGEEKGTRTLRLTFRKFKMYMNVMGMEIRADTDNPKPVISNEERENDPGGIISRSFTLIAGKSFTMKVNEEGQILAVEGLEATIDSIVNGIDVPDHIRMQIRASLKDQFNEQAIREELSHAFYIFPNRKVKVGDSWEKTFNTDLRMPASHKTRFTVTAMDGPMVSITTETEIAGTGELKVQGNESGKLVVDSRSGLTVNCDFSQETQTRMDEMTFNIKARGKIMSKTDKAP